MKILDTRWFCGRTDVGIVRVEDPHDGIKYYISGFLPTTEAADSKHIADWGQPFPTDAGNVLFGITSAIIPQSEDHARAMVTVGLQYLTEKKHGKI